MIDYQPAGTLLAEGTNVSVLRGDGGSSASDGRADPAPSIDPFCTACAPAEGLAEID